MSIRKREEVIVRPPPTQSPLSLAAYRLADELGGRDIPQQDRDDAAEQIYNFAAKSVATAWSLINAAVMAVRCRIARDKLKGIRGDRLQDFEMLLEEAHKGDMRRLNSLKNESKIKKLLLRGIPQGRRLNLGKAAFAFLLEAMRYEFNPIQNSPMDQEDFPRFLQENLQFLDFLARLVLTDAQFKAYAQAKAADKAERAQADAEPAPDEEQADEDPDDAEPDIDIDAGEHTGTQG
jgi:hypothetical protein